MPGDRWLPDAAHCGRKVFGKSLIRSEFFPNLPKCPHEQAEAAGLEFDNFRLDAGKRQLSRDGEPVTLHSNF